MQQNYNNQPIIYANAVTRLIANIIDVVILALFYSLFKKVVGTGFMQDIVFYLAIMIFYIYCWRLKQATPGKMIFSMKIVDQNTLMPAKPDKYFVRFVILYGPLFITLICNNIISAIFDNLQVFNLIFTALFVVIIILFLIFIGSMFMSKNRTGLHDNLLGLCVIHD